MHMVSPNSKQLLLLTSGDCLMLDQKFNAKNFRQIFDAENRKGVDVSARFFPNLETHYLAHRSKSKEVRECRKEYNKERRIAALGGARKTFSIGKSKLARLESKLLKLLSERSEARKRRSIAIDQEMERLSMSVANPNFKLSLTRKMGPRKKVIYCTDETAEAFFVIKLLQRNIHRLYNVKQASRHDLTCRLRDALGAGFLFELVRTDISSFYESIDRKKLYNEIDNASLLSVYSKRFISQIFDAYYKLSGKKTGIPRGVGVSAYLAEIYMRKIDSAINELPGIVLYCRFVDDIVAVFARPSIGVLNESYLIKIREIFERSKLTCSEPKTKEYKFKDLQLCEFDYLGYKFAVRPRAKNKSKSLDVSLSKSSVDKIERRLNATFSAYAHTSKFNSRIAFREISARIKFLTGNSRLVNSKSGTATGIYYNNPLVTNFKEFRKLDHILHRNVIAIGRRKLENKLSRYGFEKGYKERVFHNFDVRQFKTIVRAWKYAKP